MSKRQHDDIHRHDLDDDHGLDSKKLKFNSDDAGTTTIIILIDNDINNIKSNVFNLLKLKFENQQLGKKLWLENRELKHYEFIPIEFSKDLYFVNNFIKRMIENENAKNYKQYPYFRWYQDYCFDIISDEVKMDINFVSSSELDDFKFSNRTPSISLINRINRICNQSETKCIEIICQFAAKVRNIRQFIKKYKDVFPFIEKLLNNEVLLLKCISSNYEVFKFIEKKFNTKKDGDNHLELFLKCVNANAKVLQYFNNSSNFSSIFEDKQVVMKVIQSIERIRGFYDVGYFGKLSRDLQNDSEIVLKAAEKGFIVLSYINSQELKNDREIVLKSVRSYGLSLKYAPDHFKNDREIVIEAVKQNCKSLKHASDDLKNDREFMSEMVSKFNAPLGYASKLLQQDRDLILSSVKTHPDTLNSDESNELLLNREFILECVKINGLCLEYAPPIYRSDNEIVNEAIKQNPFSISDIDISGMDCKNPLLDAVGLMHRRYTSQPLQYVHLLNSFDDLDVVKKLVETIPFSIHFLNVRFREHYQELTFKATLLHNGYWMKHSEDAYQERINHAYHSAKIDSNSNGGGSGDEINYYRNVNKTNLLWKDIKWEGWM